MSSYDKGSVNNVEMMKKEQASCCRGRGKLDVIQFSGGTRTSVDLDNLLHTKIGLSAVLSTRDCYVYSF